MRGEEEDDTEVEEAPPTERCVYVFEADGARWEARRVEEADTVTESGALGRQGALSHQGS